MNCDFREPFAILTVTISNSGQEYKVTTYNPQLPLHSVNPSSNMKHNFSRVTQAYTSHISTGGKAHIQDAGLHIFTSRQDNSRERVLHTTTSDSENQAGKHMEKVTNASYQTVTTPMSMLLLRSKRSSNSYFLYRKNIHLTCLCLPRMLAAMFDDHLTS